MTKEELLAYYRENKNINDEITLSGRVTGCKYKFRHYTAYFTKKDYWLHLVNGLLYDTPAILGRYEIPEENDELFNSLKVGDIIAPAYWEDIEVYFKKVDDDCFIGCDESGHISSDPLDKTFIYKSKLFKSATIKDLKKVTE